MRSRRSKRTIPHHVLVDAWHQEIQRQQLTLPPIPQSNQTLSHPSQAQAAAQAGIHHAAEREAVFRRSKVERFALENHLGQQSFADLQRAIQDSQELIQAGPNKYTTQTAIQRELDTIRLMQTGKGQVAAIATPDEIERHLAQESTLTQGQRGAIEVSGGSCDRILAWQGVAGSGKTYSLKLLKDLAETKGYTIKGFAPSAEAAHTLAKAAHIPSDTVASLLSRQVESSPTDKQSGLWTKPDCSAPKMPMPYFKRQPPNRPESF